MQLEQVLGCGSKKKNDRLDDQTLGRNENKPERPGGKWEKNSSEGIVVEEK